jgi:hypothetical protein
MSTLPDLVGRPPNPTKRTPPRLLLIHTTLLPELARRPSDPATRAPDPRPTGRPRAASAAEWMEGGGQCRLACLTHAVWHLLASPRPPKCVVEPPHTAKTASSSCGTSCRRLIVLRHLLAPSSFLAPPTPCAVAPATRECTPSCQGTSSPCVTPSKPPRSARPWRDAPPPPLLASSMTLPATARVSPKPPHGDDGVGFPPDNFLNFELK